MKELEKTVNNFMKVIDNTVKNKVDTMQKYYFVSWPESQKFMDCEDCVQSDGMSYFVPCELYEKIMKCKS